MNRTGGFCRSLRVPARGGRAGLRAPRGWGHARALASSSLSPAFPEGPQTLGKPGSSPPVPQRAALGAPQAARQDLLSIFL